MLHLVVSNRTNEDLLASFQKVQEAWMEFWLLTMGVVPQAHVRGVDSITTSKDGEHSVVYANFGR